MWLPPVMQDCGLVDVRVFLSGLHAARIAPGKQPLPALVKHQETREVASSGGSANTWRSSPPLLGPMPIDHLAAIDFCHCIRAARGAYAHRVRGIRASVFLAAFTALKKPITS
ncbi:hypothetical protein [Mesorhizobium sp. WSM2239]|uniref:Transposase n=2 Tax=unclassified Mesorhizobium TaxID=325217 RepID=A0AAU8D8G9_9HYPH